jgi:hypothetical protein
METEYRFNFFNEINRLIEHALIPDIPMKMIGMNPGQCKILKNKPINVMIYQIINALGLNLCSKSILLFSLSINSSFMIKNTKKV